MSEHKKSHEQGQLDEASFSTLQTHAKTLSVLCALDPKLKDLVGTKLPTLLSATPTIFSLLKQPGFRDIHRQLSAIASKNGHSTLAKPLAASAIASTCLSEQQKKALCQTVSTALTSFTSRTIQQLDEVFTKKDAKTVRALLPLLDPRQQQTKGHELLFRAVETGWAAMIETLAPLLQFNEIYFSKASGTVLHIAADKGDMACLRLLLAQPTMIPATYTQRNAQGHNPLHIAIARNHAKAVPILLPVSEVEAETEQEGITALYIAASAGQLKTVEQLLADPYKANIMHAAHLDGATPLHVASEWGHTEIVRLLLQKRGSSDITQPMKKGYTALMKAVEKNHPAIVKLLLPHFIGTDLTWIFQYLDVRAFSYSPGREINLPQSVKMILLLLNAMQEIPENLHKTCIYLLYNAMLEDQFELLELLSVKLPASKIFSETRPDLILPVLHLAAKRGKVRALQILTAALTTEQIAFAIAGPSAEQDFGSSSLVPTGKTSKFTPLSLATQENHFDAATVLLEKPGSAQHVLIFSGTSNCLHIACLKDNLPLVKLFLKKLSPEEADYPTTSENSTPLAIALIRRNLPLIELLVNHLGPIQIFNNLRETIGQVYCSCNEHRQREVNKAGIPKLLLLLQAINNLAVFPKNLEELYLFILDLVVEKDLDEQLARIVLKKITPGKIISHSPMNTFPIFHFAAYFNKINFLNLFLPYLNPLQANFPEPKSSATPLYLAAQEGHLQVVQLLLATMPKTLKISVIIDPLPNGYSPLHVAIDAKGLKVVEEFIPYLKDSPASLAGRFPPNFDSPLLMATENNSEEIATLLLPFLSADEVHMPNGENRLPMHFAVGNNNPRLVKLLVVDGSKSKHINSLDDTGFSPLMLAIKNGYTDIALMLIDHLGKTDPAALTLRGKEGTALSIALAQNNKEIVKKLHYFLEPLGLTAQKLSQEDLQRIDDSGGTKQWKTKHAVRASPAIHFVPASYSHADILFNSAAPQTAKLHIVAESKARFHQPAPAPVQLPSADKLAENHYYQVKSRTKKMKQETYIQLSDQVVAQAIKEGVWEGEEGLKEFLKRHELYYVGQEREVQGLKKLGGHLNAKFSVFWLTLRTEKLGDVRLHSSLSLNPKSKGIFAGRQVTIIHLDHYGDHSLRPAPAMSASSAHYAR